MPAERRRTRGEIDVMQKKGRKRIHHSAIAGLSALALLAGSTPGYADEITLDDGTSDYQEGGGSIDAGGSIDTGGSDSPFLIEDSGEDVMYNAGVPMDTLQDAMESGDTKTLEKIASLGALTSNPASSSKDSSGSGIGGGGAYRGVDEDDVDDEEYYDLHLDEGDADEVETSQTDVSESPGPLMAASAERVQEHLNALTQVDSPTGSDGELTIAAYIETKMGEMGYTVQEQAFHEGVLNEDGIDAPGVNILAERGANSQTNRKQDIFLVVTHYDSKRSPDEGDPFANDKSGAAALIESARILSEVVTDTDICFLFLSGEEDGGYGAQSFLSALSEENLSRISGVLSVERVGYDSGTPYVLKTLTGESNPIGDIVQPLGIANDAHLSLRDQQTDLDEDAGTWVGVGESSDGYIDDRTAAQIAAAQAGEVDAGENAIDLDSEEFLASDEEDTQSIELDEPETEGEPVPMPSAWSYLKDSSPTMSTFANHPFPTVRVSQYMPDLDAASYQETLALGLADTTIGAVDEAMARVQGIETGTDVVLQTNADGTPAAAIEPEGSTLTGSADEGALEPGEMSFPEMNPADALGSQEGAPADLPGMEAAGLPGMEASGPVEYDDLPVVDASLVADTTNVIAAALATIMDPAT